MSVNIPQFKKLTFLKEESELLSLLEDFIKFLKEHKADGDKPIKADNIKSVLLSKNGIRFVNDSTYITFQGLLVYVINRREDYFICKSVFDSITQILTGQKITDISTLFNLYEEVATVKLSVTFCDVAVDESYLTSINTEYKYHFTPDEWQNICCFEYHFQKNYPEILSYEEQLVKKTKYLKTLKEIVKCTQSCASSKIPKYITDNQSRRQAADAINGQTLTQNSITHTFAGFHESLSDLKNHTNINSTSFVAVECPTTLCSGHPFGVHVFAEASGLNQGSFEEDARIIRTEFQKCHKVYIPEVIFVETGTLQKYFCSTCSGVHKFHFRDDYFAKKLSYSILYVSRSTKDSGVDPQNSDVIECESSSYCRYCFRSIKDSISKPLDWRTFDFLNEWYLEVPLELQIILSNIFINKTSIRQTEATQAFIASKLSRLYALFEFGLNIYNKNHYGINQQLNTEELIVNYHALSTVFSITAQCGATHSLKFANNWLQQRSDVDQVYFETFLKKYLLTYKGRHDHLVFQKLVCMRDCLAIFFLDNLVRLRDHTDPDRGKNRKSQLCTLPMTVKGLPRDSDTAATWHLAGCKSETNCACMDPLSLPKSKRDLLFQNSENEEKALQKFKLQVYCGIGFCVNELQSLVSEYIEFQNAEKFQSSEVNELDKSLQSMSLNDTAILTTEDWELIEQIEGKHASDIYFEDKGEEGEENDEEDENEEREEEEEDEEEEIEENEADDDDAEDSSDTEEHGENEEAEVDSCVENENEDLINEEEAVNVHFDKADDVDYYFEDSMPYVDENQFVDGIEKLNISACRDEDRDHEKISEQEIHLESLEELDRPDPKETFLFQKYIVPPLLCRHPTPAEGRDDDINLLRDVLLDIILKLGRYPDVNNKERILFAPDHKISKNLIQLIKTDKRFKQFLPEFPILHLKKSKINNLFSAYKDVGIVNLLKFMKDSEQEQDWMELMTLRNIETAARNIRRLSLSFHLAFLVRFICSLSTEDLKEILNDMEQKNLEPVSQKWMPKFNEFVENGSRVNATFALHAEIMAHCDEIVGIGIAERIGGAEGYCLLLACVKSSLPFAFLNGSTSYASFCTELLHIHYSAGHFHQKMKECLYTTPHKDSSVNFALDTQREMDHQDAIKGFRPRATLQTVIPRMAAVDHFTEVQKTRKSLNQSELNITQSSVSKNEHAAAEANNSSTDSPVSFMDSDKILNFEISHKDLNFILPVARLILRSGGLCTDPDETPRNLYHPEKISLAISILDRETYDIGQYLIMKYACQQGLFHLTPDDIPNVSSLQGPKELLQRLKVTKGATLRRSTLKSKVMTEDEQKETKRKAHVKRQSKVVDCLSSEMNTCQALVKPDCSKASLQKSQGVKRALLKLLSLCLNHEDGNVPIEERVQKENLILFDPKPIPTSLRETIKYATVEFAGVKFKTKATTGDDYLIDVQRGLIGNLLTDFPNLKRIVICEEKYSFTPDDFKAATRLKRQKTSSTSITHLKEASDIISDDKLTKSAVLKTVLGKKLISNYLARRISCLEFKLKHDLLLDVDSELITRTSSCTECSGACNCPVTAYTVPVRAVFNKETGFSDKHLLEDIKQRKGEAEMAQVGWLFDICTHLEENEAVISIVTSADIDSIVIHLFCLSIHWPRKPNGQFKNKVFVMLQKSKPEIYDITEIIHRLETRFGNDCLPNIAVSFCMGGNDFLPKFHGLSHEKWLMQVVQMQGGPTGHCPIYI